MKKQIKAVLCLLTVTVLLCTGAFAVYADTGYSCDNASLLQEGDYDIAYDEVFASVSDNSASSLALAANHIYNELKSSAEQISLLTAYAVTVDTVKDLYSNVINDNPDLFYVSSSFSYYYSNTTGYVSKIIPEYTMTQSEIATAQIIFEDGVSKALSRLDDSMNDVQKALVLHDYLCDISTYGLYMSEDKPIYHSAYGIFYDGNTVCAGYALTYSYLLKQIGIESEYATSVSMQHAWNVIKIGTSWYNVDLTYDDVGHYDQGENIRGGVMHRCFMKSDEAFSGEMGFYHFGQSTYDDTPCTDTSYDAYFWNDVTTTIPVIDCSYYYVDISTRKLKKCTADLTVSDYCSDFFYYGTVTMTGNYNDESGTTHSVEFKDPLIRVAYLDNRLYITSAKALYSVTGDSKRHLIASFSNYPVGLSYDGANIVYQIYGEYTQNTLDKAEYFKNHISANSNANYNNYPDINYDNYVNAKDFSMIKNQI